MVATSTLLLGIIDRDSNSQNHDCIGSCKSNYHTTTTSACGLIVSECTIHTAGLLDIFKFEKHS